MKQCMFGLLLVGLLALGAPASAAPAWAYVPPADASIVLPSGEKLVIQSAHKTWSVATDVNSSSFQLQCRIGDLWPGDAGRVPIDRSELSYSQLKMTPGVKYTWSTTITTSWMTGGLVQSSNVFLQVHATDYPGGVPSWPVMSFEFGPKTGFRIKSSYDPHIPASAPAQLTLYQGWGWQNNRRYKFDFEAVFDHGEGKGSLKIRRDGVLIVDKVDFPFGYGGVAGPYFKMGCYRRTPPGDVGSGRAVYTYENVVLPTPSP